MQRFLNTLARFLLHTPEGVRGEVARFFIFQRIGYVIAASCHSFWAVIFFLNGVSFLAWYNVAVAIVFTVAGLTWRRFENQIWLLVPLWFIEIPFHALLATLHTGIETLFWTVAFSSSAVCLLVYQWTWPTRAAICASLLTVTLAICILSFFVAPISQISTASEIALFVFNFSGVLGSIVMYLGLNQFLVMVAENRLEREYNRAEGLLKNILPDPIALRLKDGEHLIADDHADVTVVFADIVNFTEASAALQPAQLVETLNMVFTEFDTLAEKHGAEKIKTIGDAYMAVVGIPEPRADHAIRAVEMALDMLSAARRISARTHFHIDLRIGINSGPVVAGVIGQNKFAYDLWGDAVNVAARMEAHSSAGGILITDATRALVESAFSVTHDGDREVKGKVSMPVFLIAQPVG